MTAHPFLLACRRQPTPYTPIWLMRQAGRYMAEYRAVRERFGFLELCHHPQAAAEVTVTAVERLGVDAAIIFADILLVLEPLGVGLHFAAGDGPTISRPVREPDDVRRLRDYDTDDALAYVYAAVRAARSGLAGRVPLIGFAGAPFTLASYLIEGSGSRQYLRTKRFMYDHPGAWHDLLALLARLVNRYLRAQIAAGAECVQLFDSWVGCLSPDDYRDSVLPHVRAAIAGLSELAPVIHFGTDCGGLLALQREAGGDVIGVDWRIDLDAAWACVGHDRAVQGNLDPVTLFAPIPAIRRRAEAILARAGGRPGHIFNLGHGILPQTPVDHVRALIETVHELSAVGASR
ncbi:MAG: uroporphyrinogen decarboxylase [Candidatus Binatia bacterium]